MQQRAKERERERFTTTTAKSFHLNDGGAPNVVGTTAETVLASCCGREPTITVTISI